MRRRERTNRKRAAAEIPATLSAATSKIRKISGKKLPGSSEKLQNSVKAMSHKNEIEKKVAATSTGPNAGLPGNHDDVSSRPVILLAHGAGAGSSSDFMQLWKAMLAEATNAVEVITFDYPFMAGGRRGPPPKPEALVEFHRSQLEAAMAAHPGHPLILCGKSFGSRVSGLLAGEEDCPAKAVVCLTYPLKGANGSIRDQILLDLKRPVLCVQGTKDSLCPLDMLQEVRKKMRVENHVHIVDGGDHGLKVSAKHLKELGTTQEAMDRAAVAVVATFIASVL